MDMQMRHAGRLLGVLLVAACVLVVSPVAQRVAAQSASNNYQMVESQFGNSSSNESCSGSYCASVSIGNDSQTSPVSTPEFGEANYSEPLLEMIVLPGDSNLGEMTTEHTGVKTLQVKIRNYLTGGYRLQILGDPPKYGNRTLAALSTPTTSQPGHEQFGINVVSNTSPSFGANPIAQPGDTEALDLLTENYKTPNKFMYINGDVIAQTTTNTGGADYTITMIVNISGVTPAGKYTSDFAAVVMPYF